MAKPGTPAKQSRANLCCRGAVLAAALVVSFALIQFALRHPSSVSQPVSLADLSDADLESQKHLRNRGRNAPQTVLELAFGRQRPEAIREPQVDHAVELMPLAGGGLPVAPANADPVRLPAHLTLQAKPLRSQDMDTAAAAMPSLFQSPSGRASGDDVSPAAASRAMTDNVQAASLNAEVRPAAETDRLDLSTIPPPDDLARLLELDKLARSANRAEAVAATKEMLRLEIDETQRQLARGAVDLDPQVRRDVVEALPLVGSVNARAWLLWLSHDRDAEVRRAAISLLATSSDPALKKRVRHAAESDPDPRIRQQARAQAEPGGLRR